MYSNCTKLQKNLVKTKYVFMFPSEKKTQNKKIKKNIKKSF